MSAQSTRAVLCLNSWSPRGLVKDKDVTTAAMLPELDESESEFEMEEGWDKI